MSIPPTIPEIHFIHANVEGDILVLEKGHFAYLIAILPKGQIAGPSYLVFILLPGMDANEDRIIDISNREVLYDWGNEVFFELVTSEKTQVYEDDLKITEYPQNIKLGRDQAVQITENVIDEITGRKELKMTIARRKIKDGMSIIEIEESVIKNH